MSIKKTNNRYQLDESVYANGSRERIRKIFRTLDEAKDFQSDVRRQRKSLNRNSALHLKVRTITELVQWYYSLPRFIMLKDKSKKRNCQSINRFCKWCEANGVNYVHEFTREKAQAFITYIAEISTGRGRERHYITIKMLFSEELERDNPVISRNPFPKKSQFKKTKYKPIALSESLINQLKQHMTALEALIFDVLYYTGCRTGELQYLTKDQLTSESVRYGNHMIFNDKKNEWIHWTTKTGTEREVPLNSQSSLAFSKLCKLKASHNYVLPDECRNISHWFTRRFDKIKHLTVKTYPELQNILFPNDKMRNITPKRFRSSFITHVIRETGSAEKARVLAGQLSIETTIRHYTDDKSLDLKGAVNTLNLDK